MAGLVAARCGRVQPGRAAALTRRYPDRRGQRGSTNQRTAGAAQRRGVGWSTRCAVTLSRVSTALAGGSVAPALELPPTRPRLIPFGSDDQ